MTRKPPPRRLSPHKSSTAGDVTIKDIARHLGLSHATVSRALNDHPATNELTKARVREAALALGYVRNAGAEMMRGASSRLVGLIIPDIQNEFFSAVAKGLAQRCAGQGLHLVLAVSEDDPELERTHVMALREARVAGFVISPSQGCKDATKALLAGLPTVKLIRDVSGLAGGFVGIDDRSGAYAATRHLLALGHTRIAFVGGPEAISTAKDRLAGYLQALTESGVPRDPSYIYLGPPRPGFGEIATAHIMSMTPRPTAVLLGSARLALGAFLALRRMEVPLPGQLSVLSYGDEEGASLGGVTAMALPVADIVNALAEQLFSLIQGKDAQPTSATFPPALLVRSSTGPAPA
ncbi:MAG: LacI family DNA-binding transcriptional regulator [Azospirillaceae bacterium]|nr:LacI family DNA-binding transcriptional regulator [Azospirillaceae bacterium]